MQISTLWGVNGGCNALGGPILGHSEHVQLQEEGGEISRSSSEICSPCA
jgi:hypothetical protein